MRESKFQANLIDEIRTLLPGCVVFKTDAGYMQGFPDLMILYKKRWAALECKKEANAHHQPNQDYYVGVLDKMSFSRFIYPENKEEVLYDLQRSLKTGRTTRVLRSE